MNWPKSFRAGWMKIEVRNYEKAEGAEWDKFGHFAPQTQRIFFDDGHSVDRQANTIIHEVLHALWTTGIPSHWDNAIRNLSENDAQEFLVSALGDALTMALRDNPDFWRTLIDALADTTPKKVK